ncbi:hypothetical protein C8R43DRAFT_1090260 [Mycena crocata]|nr:hypothetical protein C8R43DRAFT_1090260 [Mycena crocata]
MLVCLNLPYEMWHLEGNTYFAGITPPPKEPTVTTITALSDPIMKQFQEMWEGKMVPTHNHPEGDFYRAAIIAAIGDIMALKKALGCAGHNAHNFCSFCKLQRSEIDRLDLENFELRQGWEVLSAAKEWLAAQTKGARKLLFAKYGTRYSSTHSLTYRDPVKHTVLGLMHNWLEGVLQHHCRLKWDIGSNAPASGNAGTFGTSSSDDDDVEMVDADDNAIAAELMDLHEDSFIQKDTPASLIRRVSSFLFIQESEDAMEPSADDDIEEDDDNDEAEEDAIYEREKPSRTVFDGDAMTLIRQGLANVVIPAWIDRPPVNLGEKAHGKLKADNWLVLFTIFFPLILPELWFHASSSRRDHKLLDNFHDLVGATNILYQMKWWGEMDLTMLRQMCRRGRLLASISDSVQTTDSKSPVVEAMQILSPRVPVSTDSVTPKHLSPAQETAYNGSGVILDAPTYELILRYWNQTYSPSYIRAAELTYDLLDTDLNVFPSRAVPCRDFTHKTRLFTIFKNHHGGSSISFRHPLTGRKNLGYIELIWTQVLQGQKRTFVVVRPHTALNPADAAKTPYPTHPRFACVIGPKGTFGIQQAITLFVDSLHRNRD